MSFDDCGTDATLRGHVLDLTQQAVPAATVETTHTVTGQIRTTVSNDRGGFLFAWAASRCVCADHRIGQIPTSATQGAAVETVGETVTFTLTLDVVEVSERVAVTASAARSLPVNRKLGLPKRFTAATHLTPLPWLDV